MIRTGIAARDPLVLLGIRYLLDREPDIRVAFATDVPSAVALGELDCLVLDMNLFGTLPTLPRPVIGLADDERTTVTPPPEVAEVYHKSEATACLVGAVHQVVAGRITPRPPAVVRCGAADLSPREQEVLGHIAEGFTHGQVARRIGISQHTVDTYVKRIRSKLGAGNKAQLVRAALTTL